MNSCFILGIKSESHISECLTGFEIFLVLYWFQVCNRLTLLLQIICNPLTPSESALQCISCNKLTSLCHMSENDMQNPWKNHIFITKFLTCTICGWLAAMLLTQNTREYMLNWQIVRFCLFPIVLKIYLWISSLFTIPDAEILVTWGQDPISLSQ